MYKFCYTVLDELKVYDIINIISPYSDYYIQVCGYNGIAYAADEEAFEIEVYPFNDNIIGYGFENKLECYAFLETASIYRNIKVKDFISYIKKYEGKKVYISGMEIYNIFIGDNKVCFDFPSSDTSTVAISEMIDSKNAYFMETYKS